MMTYPGRMLSQRRRRGVRAVGYPVLSPPGAGECDAPLAGGAVPLRDHALTRRGLLTIRWCGGGSRGQGVEPFDARCLQRHSALAGVPVPRRILIGLAAGLDGDVPQAGLDAQQELVDLLPVQPVRVVEQLGQMPAEVGDGLLDLRQVALEEHRALQVADGCLPGEHAAQGPPNRSKPRLRAYSDVPAAARLQLELGRGCKHSAAPGPPYCVWRGARRWGLEA